MAQRVIHWARLDIGILQDEKIDMVRSLPEGDSMFVVWIGLICLAMKTCDAGYLYATEGIPYETKHLARIFNVSKPVVDQAVQAYEQLGMLTTHKGKAIQLLNFTRHQSNEDALDKLRSASRRSSQRYRENQKQLEDKRKSDSENKKGDSTVTSPEKEPTPRELLYGFIEFKETYPKDFDMEAARKEWMKLRPGTKLQKEIIAGLKSQIQTKKWKEEKGRFIPSPAKFIRDKRWKDKIEIPKVEANPFER